MSLGRGNSAPRSGSHMRNPPDTSRLSPLLRTCPPPTSIFRQNFKLENYNSENKSPPVSCLHDTCDHNPQRAQPKATSFYAAQAVAFSNFKFQLLTSVSVSSGLTQKWNFWLVGQIWQIKWGIFDWRTRKRKKGFCVLSVLSVCVYVCLVCVYVCLVCVLSVCA